MSGEDQSPLAFQPTMPVRDFSLEASPAVTEARISPSRSRIVRRMASGSEPVSALSRASTHSDARPCTASSSRMVKPAIGLLSLRP